MFEGIADQIKEQDATEATGTPSEDQKVEESATGSETEQASDEKSEVKTETVTYSEEVEVEDPPEEEEYVSEEPTAQEISDTALFADPLNPGETISGKELKSRQLMQADYTRKTQALAEERRRLMQEATEDHSEEEVEEAASTEDPYSFLDDDDPLKAKLKAIDETVNRTAHEAQEKIDRLERQLATKEQEENTKALQATERRLLETFPVLDQEELDQVEAHYFFQFQQGKEVDLEKMVEARANKLMKMQEGSVKAWKEKNRVKQPPSEATGAPAGSGEKSGPTRKDLMKGSIADMIRQEDSDRSREANR